VTLRENGELMDPEKIIDGLSKELNSALKAMAKAKDLDEKEVYSRIVKNLCESLGVFFNLASEMMSDLENEDIPF
jgi:RecJ-like exonuclease